MNLMKMRSVKLCLVLSMLAVLMITGCARDQKSTRARRIDPDTDATVSGTGIESADIRMVVRQLAGEILSVPQIANAENPPVIALLPVKNRTRFAIDADIFTKNLRDTLIEYAGAKVRFIDRERLDEIEKEREQKRSGRFEAGELKNLPGADFFLTGELSGLTAAYEGGVSDYVVYSFQLDDAETTDIIFSRKYEVKKEGMWGVMYR